MKLEVKQHMLGPWLGRLGIAEGHKAVLRKHLNDHNAYRAHVEPLPDSPDVDLTWKAGWPVSSNEVAFLIEAAQGRETL